MIRVNSLKISIKHSDEDIRRAILDRLRISPERLLEWKPVKISIDARRKDDVHYVYAVDVRIKDEAAVLKNKKLKDIGPSKTLYYPEPEILVRPEEYGRPVIVGAGPAGLICSYKLAKAGFRPILIERGAPVGERTRDVEHFWEKDQLDPNSNVQFGEGGAGTFSDGKLNTMVHDEYGRISEVFRIFVEHGADSSIMYTNKPHIGTDRLKKIVASIREDIIANGGEVRFHSRLTDICLQDKKLRSVIINDTEELPCSSLVLAIGHSARDTFEMLESKGLMMEPKAFAAGIRIQHPQELISMNQYGQAYRDLPAADYKLTYTASNSRGVYSFCMCPGGFVVNASSEAGLLAVNGMSNSDRSEVSANSALVVTVGPEDFPGSHVLAGMEFQRRLEKAAYECGKGHIPAQYLKDFRSDSASSDLAVNRPNTKGMYTGANLRGFLPDFISASLLEAMPVFGRSIKGYDMDDAVMMGVESRTSSPVRITRDEDLQAVGFEGIYPCGEGAGYAGGITSAAMDGLRIYEAIVSGRKNNGQK